MTNTGATFGGILGAAGSVLCLAIPALLVLATVAFLYGIIKYIAAAGDEEKLSESKMYIIYGLIGLFAMVAVWGIVNAIASSIFGATAGGGAC